MTAGNPSDTADMRLYIVRHGKAVEAPTPHACAEFPRPEGFPDDWYRTLAPRGFEQVRSLAQRLFHDKSDESSLPERRLGFILSSPYPRALQTARILHDAATSVGSPELRVVSELEVDRPVSEALRMLDDYRGCRAVMLVGHNPQLGELLSVLACGLPAQELVLKTGELVALDVRSGAPVGAARQAMRLRMEESAVR